MSIREEAIEIINRNENTADAAEEILNGSRSVILYVLAIGIEAIKSKMRRHTRQSLKREIVPEYVAGRTFGSIKLSQKTIKRMEKVGDRLWLDWKVGLWSLGEMTKEQLLAQVESEKKSAHGSLQNAEFYRALAEPLRAGQSVKDFWSPVDAGALKEKIYKKTEAKRPYLK